MNITTHQLLCLAAGPQQRAAVLACRAIEVVVGDRVHDRGFSPTDAQVASAQDFVERPSLAEFERIAAEPGMADLVGDPWEAYSREVFAASQARDLLGALNAYQL